MLNIMPTRSAAIADNPRGFRERCAVLYEQLGFCLQSVG